MSSNTTTDQNTPFSRTNPNIRQDIDNPEIEDNTTSSKSNSRGISSYDKNVSFPASDSSVDEICILEDPNYIGNITEQELCVGDSFYDEPNRTTNLRDEEIC